MLKKTKFLAVALAAAFSLTFTGCGSNDAENTEGSVNGSPVESGENETTPGDASAQAPEYPTVDWSTVEDASESDFKVDHVTAGLIIEEYLGEGGNVKIPETINGEKVVYIDDAFRDCTGLTGVYIPDSVTEIRQDAFRGCTGLLCVRIPDAMTKMGIDAFTDTQWLNDRLENNPLVVENGVLVDGRTCSGDVVIPDGVYLIADQAFYGCEGLTSITLSGSVALIGIQSFAFCTNLTDITIPDSVTWIRGEDVFMGCEKITLNYKGTDYSYDELGEWFSVFAEETGMYN